ncbi:MAG: glycosyltransferase [Pirellulaceae bacterium]
MPRKIALNIHALHGGGAERLMSQLATRWANDHEVHLITWAAVKSDKYPLPPAVRRHGFDLQYASRGLLSGLFANWNRVRILRRKLRELEPDLVLSFSDQMNIVTLEAARGLGLPVWISEHSNPEQQRLSRLWEAWRNRTYATCTGCIALTPGIARYMQRWISAERIRVIPPAISPPSLPAADESILADRKPRFVFLGRLSREKGVDVLLQAWRELSKDRLDWQLQIVGDGPERPRLEQQANDLQGVKFSGWADDPWSILREAGCFVLPSRYEGFPVALLEAMSQGTPAIATRCSNAMDALTRKPDCLVLIDPESVTELVMAMRTVAQNAELRAKLGSTAQDVAAAYTWSAIGPLWDAVLELPSNSKSDAVSYSLKR